MQTMAVHIVFFNREFQKFQSFALPHCPFFNLLFGMNSNNQNRLPKSTGKAGQYLKQMQK